MVPQQVSTQEMQLLREFHKSWSFPDAISRPQFLVFGLLSLTLFLAACGPAADGTRLNRRTLAEATNVLDDVAKTELAMSPELASRLGLEQNQDGTSSGWLDDHSQAGFERRRLIRIDLLARVRTHPALPEDHQVAKDLVVAEDALARLVALQPVSHGHLSLSRVRPYAIGPRSGVWIEGPELLANDHRIDTFDDANAYFERLQTLPGAVDDLRRRLIADAEAGLIAPASLIDETRTEIRAFLNPESHHLNHLLQTLENLSRGLPDTTPEQIDDLLTDSRYIIDVELSQAYEHLLITLDDLHARAPSQAGLWAQPAGAETYSALLKWYSSDDQALDDLHLANIDDVLQRTADLQLQLDGVGIESGPLVQRLAAFTARHDAELASVAANDDNTVDDTPPPVMLGTVIRPLSPAPFGGFARVPARIDGQRPALLRRDEAEISRWPTHMHGALRLQTDVSLRQPYAALMAQPRSLARTLAQYPSLQDGWHLYATEVSADAHLPAPDDAVGLKQLLLLNVAMAAVDTGIHHKRWSLQQAAAYLTETTGLSEPLMRRAALHVVANPGEASARMIAYRRLISLKARASGVLGQRYNELEFQSVLLTDGPRPFSIIESDVDRWYEAILAERG